MFDSKKQFIQLLLWGVSGVLFIFLLASFRSGDIAAQSSLAEAIFEDDERDEEDTIEFKLDEETVCRLNINGGSLNQSWISVMALILDAEGKVVMQHAFELEYYSGVEGGESWSEGDREASAVFKLPAGEYTLIVYGEDAPESDPGAAGAAAGYATIEQEESLQISLEKNVPLSRYYAIFFILTTFGAVIYTRAS